MIYLAEVKHDIRTHAIEVTWREETGTELRQVKCHTYSPPQRDMLIADMGDAATPYLAAFGWTPEFCAACKAEEERVAAEIQAEADRKAAEEAEAKAKAEKDAYDAEVLRQAQILRDAQALVAAGG